MFLQLKNHKFFLAAFIFSLLCTGCSGASPPISASASGPAADAPQGSRDSTPVVLVPAADNYYTESSDVASMDASHTDEGYVMINYYGSNPKVKFQLTTPDGTTYTYSLHGGYEVFPLTGGNGTYGIKVFENVVDDQYSLGFSSAIDVSILNEFGPYLYPNQYVNFNAETRAVAKGAELAFSANDELDVVTNVYNYVTGNISYDKEKASTVESGYLPVPDETMDSGKGICFDYAALMATMLRFQGIPTRLEVGYAGTAYHAWVSVHITNVGWLNGIIEFDGTSWELVDPTLGASKKGDSEVKKFIGDGSNYMTKYVY